MQVLLLDKGHKLHHFPVRLNLAHVLLDGQLLALEQAALFAPVDVERGERVDEKVGSTIVVVTLNHDISQSRWLLIFIHRILKIFLAEVAWKDQYVVIIARLVSEGLWNDVLL